MMNQELTKYVRDWFARADEDLDIAQLILGEEMPYNPACFHAQQAAEKYFKGFLAHHERHVRKIHDLDALLQECIKIDQSFENLQNDARFLGRFYVESRYPDDYVEFAREDAEKGLESAIRIKEFILGKIKSGKIEGFSIVGIIIIIAAIAVLGGVYFAYKNYSENKVCSKDLKICPDGSHVSRIPPMCEFPGCPAPSQASEIDISTWKTYRNTDFKLEIKYPPDWKVTPFFLEKDGKKSFDGMFIHPSGAIVEIKEKFINVGGTFDARGTKTRCRLLEKPLFKCYEVNDIPFYTSSNDAHILSIFEALVQSAVTISVQETIDTSNRKTYRNEKYGVTFRYPAEWKIIESAPFGFPADLDASEIELFSDINTKKAEIKAVISCMLPWGGLDEARTVSEDYTRLNTNPSFIDRVGFGISSAGGLIREVGIGTRKLFVFRQGCYECYENPERSGKDGFSAIACSTGKNKNNNVSDRCLRIVTALHEVDSNDFKKLENIFLDNFIPSIKLDSNFEDFDRCVGQGETKG